MSDKKNIDRLFQEKFKNFEVAPDDAVWKKIQAQKNKDRKRVLLIPFWYRIAGVAALIAITITVGSVLLKDTTIPDPAVVTEDRKNKDLIPNKNHVIAKDELVDVQKNQESRDNDGTSKNSNSDNEAITQNSLQTTDRKDTSFDIRTATENSISKKKDATLITKNTSDKKELPNASKTEKNVRITTSSNQKKNKILSEQQTNITSAVTDLKNTSAFNKDRQKASDGIFSDENTKNEIVGNNTSSNKELENLTEKKNSYVRPSNKQDEIKESVADNTKATNLNDEKVSNQNTNQSKDNDKKSIFDAIKDKEQKETVVAETNNGKKWNISPNVAPVYYDSFGGSSIDPQFSDNNKQGEVNLSYGVQVAYAISKRFIVRSGVHKVDVGYNTEDVGFGISSITRGDNSLTNEQSIVVSDYQGGPASFAPAPVDVNDEILVKSQNPGLLNHSIGYIEVPLELKYSLTDSKIGIHMIGGVSTLFLEDEEVSIIAGSFQNENVEREDTVNDISFSGNIGIGFDYKLSDQFQINMEPIFKYQFNGFKESAQDFKPYYFGIYTGISFKF
ncbi:amidase domain-containing protein [Aquimarina sp. M1]